MFFYSDLSCSFFSNVKSSPTEVIFSSSLHNSNTKELPFSKSLQHSFLKNQSWSVLTKIRSNQPENNHKTTRDSSKKKPKNQPKKKLEITTWLPTKKPLFLYVSCTCNTRPIHPTVTHSARTNTDLPLSGSFLIVVQGQFRVQNEFVCFV